METASGVSPAASTPAKIWSNRQPPFARRDAPAFGCAACANASSGRSNPALTAAAHAQLDRLTLTSRAFGHDLLEPFADFAFMRRALIALGALNASQRARRMNTPAFQGRFTPAERLVIMTLSDGLLPPL